jgi:hypothetical protein
VGGGVVVDVYTLTKVEPSVVSTELVVTRLGGGVLVVRSGVDDVVGVTGGGVVLELLHEEPKSVTMFVMGTGMVPVTGIVKIVVFPEQKTLTKQCRGEIYSEYQVC